MEKQALKLDRQQALTELKKHVKNKNLLKHMYACEAIMRALAKHFGEDEEAWGLAGLLHDIDYDQTANDLEQHSLLGAKMLEELGLPEELVYAVKVHNQAHGLPRVALMDKALFAVDPTSGLIVAAALIKPEKKISAIDAAFVLKRMDEKAFAKGANRDQIRACSELGLSLEAFMTISVEAMQAIADDLGL